MPSTAEDRDEILQLLYRYNHTIDSGDAEGWADLWSDGAVFDAMGREMSGRETLVAFAAASSGMRHVVVNPLIEVAGDTAHVSAYFMLLAGGAVTLVGAYDDELVRTPDGWRFAKRVFTADAPPQS